MIPFAAKRIVQSVPVLLLASLIIFMLIRSIPGDPASVYAGTDAAPETIERVRHAFGLDRPWPVQYVLWLWNTVQGNLGTSFASGIGAAGLIGGAAPATLQLTTFAAGFALVIGVLFGSLSAVNAGRWFDKLVSAYNVVGLSVPDFWLGFLFILLFAVELNWLPAGGRVPLTESPAMSLASLVLPAIALGWRHSSIVARFTRTSTMEVLSEDYVRTAKAKGLGTTSMVRHHLIKNAMIPVLPVLGIEIGRLFAGAVIIESVFAWPGLGRLLISSVGNRDYAVLQALLILYVGIFLLSSLVVDLLQAAFDPRIRAARINA